jgi:polyferredoxin
MKGKAKIPGRPGRFSLVFIRRFSQLLFFGIFIFLFLRTDYTGSDTLEYAVNIFFRLDPFLAAVTMLATRTVISLMLPAFIVLVLASLFGRSFCGWFCPMGSLLDGFNHLLGTNRKSRVTLYPRLGRWLLYTCVLLAFCGFHIGGYFDPFSILVRGASQALYPAFHGMAEAFFTYTYVSLPAWVNAVTEPFYGWLKDMMLPADRKYFELVWLSCAVLVVVLGFEMVQKRFFCRNICPLGALFGLVSGRGLLRAKGGDKECGKCRVCSSLCRMGAIDDNRKIEMSSCNLCMECRQKCPRQIISFGFTGQRQTVSSTGLSRRQFFGVLATGILLPAVERVHGVESRNIPLLIRPPGALDEDEFTGRCVRCSECIQVCIGNALQPALMEGGLDTLFTPKLVARTGYCEYNCTLCGQVCPTGAISNLTLVEKHGFKIGHAWFDRNLCLPYAKGISCMVCEEHCPTPVKAIQFREVEIVTPEGERRTVKQPYIVDEYCIGCGICEFKCPLPGTSAIRITNAGEQRDSENILPSAGAGSYGYG